MEVEPWPKNLEKNEMIVGTWWESIGNFEHIKNKEDSLSPTPFEPQKEKNMYNIKCWTFPLGTTKIYFSKLLVTNMD